LEVRMAQRPRSGFPSTESSPNITLG